ncbi:MAG: hypothetical protein J6J60_08815 [Clostridia bacterium]|nr:hypothetical protein [Clostridia bacterium]MBP3597474.1 hypothetical protein [Clostridia bacterium]
MKKEKVALVVAFIIDIVIFGSLIISNLNLKEEIAYLKNESKDMQDKILAQNDNIKNIETKLNDNTDFIENLKEQDRIKEDPYYEAITNLDNTVFLTNFDNYNPSSDEIKITESQAKKTAQKGFEESKNRIAAEGVDNIESETIEIIETVANNYFTRYYYQRNENYDNLRRTCYAITRRQSDLENGVTIYVDVTTGLIIGGMAFGD